MRPGRAGRAGALRSCTLAALLAGGAASALAASDALRFCNGAAALTARQQDRLLRVAARLQQLLDGSGQRLALLARSGLNLKRFGLRYSHAGISLRHSPHTPWAVRQLYYACDEGQSLLFDQGLAGFLFGTDNADAGHVSVLLLPAAPAAALEKVALDKTIALQLLAAQYSANAYPFSTRYQNCNQWLAEMLATAWGGLAGSAQPREAAQAWLKHSGYAPAPVAVRSHLLMFAGGFAPWLRYDDHPEADRFALRFQTSVPEAIEAFLLQREPLARRVELCHNTRQLVLRQGWTALSDDCRAEPGDEVMTLD